MIDTTMHALTSYDIPVISGVSSSILDLYNAEGLKGLHSVLAELCLHQNSSIMNNLVLSCIIIIYAKLAENIPSSSY